MIARAKKKLQRKTGNSTLEWHNPSAVSPIVREVLRSPGQPLHSETRALMELKPYHFIENFLSLEPEIARSEVKFFYLSGQSGAQPHPTMSTLVWVKKYGPFFNVGGGDVTKGDVYIHFYKKGT